MLDAWKWMWQSIYEMMFRLQQSVHTAHAHLCFDVHDPTRCNNDWLHNAYLHTYHLKI
jgi:hypothetical protein